jgi:hypothetical protein
MAPERFFRHRSHLSRYPERSVVRSSSQSFCPFFCGFTSEEYNVFVGFRAAAMTLRTVLLSLQALLAAPEPDDPQDAVVANQYKNTPAMFDATARYWTHVYAGGL